MRGIVLECRQRGQGAQCPRVDALVQLVHGARNEPRGLLPGLEHDVEYVTQHRDTGSEGVVVAEPVRGDMVLQDLLQRGI